MPRLPNSKLPATTHGVRGIGIYKISNCDRTFMGIWQRELTRPRLADVRFWRRPNFDEGGTKRQHKRMGVAVVGKHDFSVGWNMPASVAVDEATDKVRKEISADGWPSQRRRFVRSETKPVVQFCGQPHGTRSDNLAFALLESRAFLAEDRKVAAHYGVFLYGDVAISGCNVEACRSFRFPGRNVAVTENKPDNP